MSDFDSIPLDGPEPNRDEGTVNRPAQGARKATASDLSEDDWTGGDEGGDFLGLEADLVTGAPPAQDYGHSQLELASSEPNLHVPAPQPQPASTSYASQSDYSDESFSEGGYEQDPNAFAPEDYADEGDLDGGPQDFGAEVRPSNGARSGILITIGLALGMGATAVVAMDYFGMNSEEEALPLTAANTAAPAPTDRGATLEVSEPVANDASGLAEVSPDAPTWSAEALEAPAFEGGQDPLIGTLLGEDSEPLDLNGMDSAEPATTPEPQPRVAQLDTNLEGVEGTSSPMGTIAGWFAPDGQQPLRDGGSLDAVPSGEVAQAETTTDGGPQTATREAPAVGFTEEAAGPQTPEPTELAGAVPEGGLPASEGREGVAAFEGLSVTPVLPVTRAADDLAKMDVVWRGEEVPFDMIASAARIWTPQVGAVRVTTKRGEVFEGRLTAVGKRRVWLGSSNGEMALDGDTVSLIEHVTRTLDETPNTDVAAATGKRVKITAPGGTFEGTVLSTSGTQVTVVTDGGGRITLDEPTIEPVREGIKVKVKVD